MNNKYTTICFGKYPQGLSGKVAPIEWVLLEIKGNTALVISKYAIDFKPYSSNEYFFKKSWETSTLRHWLNDEFIKESFDSDEKKRICVTAIEIEPKRQKGLQIAKKERYNKIFNIASISNSQSDTFRNQIYDKVFLLSKEEALKYFASINQRKCSPTEYAICHLEDAGERHKTNSKPLCRWWLRSMGNTNNSARYIEADGSIDDDISIDDILSHRMLYGWCNTNNAVRPAMWILLDT